MTLRKWTAALLLAGSACICAAADDLDDLVSTASRTPLARVQIGSAVSVIERETIERRQSLLVSDILQDLPGVSVSRAGGPGQQTQLRIRGVEANQLLVIIDGVEANDPGVGDEFSYEQLTAWDIERIELVRGPQSALWGSDALGGVLNVTTRRGKSGLRADGLLEGGSFGSSQIAGRLGGTADRWSADLSVSRFATDGINVSAGVDDSDGFTGDRDDRYENLTASLNGEFRASDALRLSFFGRLSDSANDFDALGFDGLPVDADRRSDVELGFLRASAEYTLMDDRWRHEVRASLLDSDRENRADGSLTNTQMGRKTGFAYQTSYDFEAAAGEYRGVLAIDVEREQFAQSFVDFEGANQAQSRDTRGYVAELIAQPIGGLNLSASLRYDDFSNIRGKTTYRVTGSYLLQATDSRVHGSYGTGLKQPTFTELFGFFPDSFTGNPQLIPEESEGWDIGVEQRLLSERILVDITYFSARLTDEIQTVFDPQTFLSSVANASGVSRRRGVEVELSARLPAGFELAGSYTYTDATEPVAGEAAAGNRREIRRPRQMAALNLNYAFADRRANLNLNLSYTGDQQDDSFPPPSFQRTTVGLDAYTLVNLAGSFALSSRLSLIARVENLLDEDYQNLLGYRSPGVAYFAGLRMRFDGN